MIRLKIIGTQWKVTEKLKGLKSSNLQEDWEVTYATPIYGGWDLMIECKFQNLEDLEKIVSACRTDECIAECIDATTTLISTKRNYPF